MMIKKIKNYNDYYITSYGEVISKKRNTEKILKKRINSKGYYYVNLCKNGIYKSHLIHRLVCYYFVKNQNNYNVVNHIDGNKLNNNYKNLEWCTLSHNSKEAARLGLLKPKKGNECNLATGNLNIEKANEIRKLRKEGKLSYSKIAILYNVSKSAIIQICQNKIYKI